MGSHTFSYVVKLYIFSAQLRILIEFTEEGFLKPTLTSIHVYWPTISIYSIVLSYSEWSTNISETLSLVQRLLNVILWWGSLEWRQIINLSTQNKELNYYIKWEVPVSFPTQQRFGDVQTGREVEWEKHSLFSYFLSFLGELFYCSGITKYVGIDILYIQHKGEDLW